MKFCKNIDLGIVAVRPRNLLRVGMFALVGLMSINISQSVHAQTEPETVEKIMKASGFKVEAETIGGLLFLPNEDGSYKLVARFSEAPESEFCEQKQKIHKKTGEVIDTIGICIIPNWKAPTGFENDLANDGMAIDSFWNAVNINGELPVLGSAEEDSVDAVQAETYNINAKLNGQIRETEFGIWTSCWKLNATSSSAIEPAMRGDCRAVKSKMLDLNLSVAKAENEAAKAENEAAKAENEAAKAENEAAKTENEAAKARNEAATIKLRKNLKVD